MSQIDSAYTVVNMRIMAPIGTPVYREIEKDEKRVVPYLHSVGAPLRPGESDVPWPQNNFAMLIPPSGFEGSKVWVGDDIAWIKPATSGQLRAIDPESDFFGVAPGTSKRTNPNAMATLRAHTIFANAALVTEHGVPNGDIWWEGMTEAPPAEALDWRDRPWPPKSSSPATPRMAASPRPPCSAPQSTPSWEDPDGVPISAIVFGGRRPATMPLVFQAFNRSFGVYIGATVGSETTAAAGGKAGTVRRDPMAMLPFCGYHMGDSFRNWIKMQRKRSIMPRVFHVNCFARNTDGRFLWPGCRENMRVLNGSSTACMAVFGVRRHRLAGRCISTTWSGRAWTSLGRHSTRFRRSTVWRGSGRLCTMKSSSSRCTIICLLKWSMNESC